MPLAEIAPTVSINLCCYNSERFLEVTLRGVFAQTYRDWELVVVDDGSTDRTAAIVQRHLDEGWPIRYHFQPNTGLGRARQKALELSRGGLIALLDHDDVWLPAKLARQIALLERRPAAALVYGDAFVIDEAGARRGRYFDTGRPARGPVFDQVLRNILPICLPTVMVRRVPCLEVGGFRAFTYAEEYDLFLRLAERYEFDFVDEPVAEYRQHAGSYSRHLDRLFEERLTILGERYAHGGPHVRSLAGELALNHAMYALWCRRHGLFARARAQVRSCLALHPWRVRPYAYCVPALLPRVLARAAARLRVFVWARSVRGRLRRAVRALARSS